MFYGVDITHRKDQKATSFFTLDYASLSKEQIKWAVEKCCKNAVVTRVFLCKGDMEKYDVPMAQGLYVLDLNYSKRRWERMKEKFQAMKLKIKAVLRKE
jgi:hypothetical protein